MGNRTSNTSGLWRGGSPGRPRGVPNKANAQVKAFCLELLSDPEYVARFTKAFKERSLSPGLEAMVWAYAFGRPRIQLEVHRGADVSDDEALDALVLPGERVDDDESGGAEGGGNGV